MLERVLDAGFGHPRGLLGRIGGALMAGGNSGQEAIAVQRAEIRHGERVLAVGVGPGIGVQWAAARVGPAGHVVALDPSPTMRRMATRRCRRQVDSGVVEIRDGTAEQTGCADRSLDVAVSVNSVMLWQRPAGFAELSRVLRPGGRLVVSVHRHVLSVPAEQLAQEAADAGFVDVTLGSREGSTRRGGGPKVELLAQLPDSNRR
jgi:ubiquinone/menaquinone biosynthesis C-methylase UbiE